MEVNFDNLRKQTAFAYDKLARKLNSRIDEEGHLDGFPSRQIREEMEELRSLIGAVCFCNDANDPNDCNDLTDWWDEQDIARFAPENDEDGE